MESRLYVTDSHGSNSGFYFFINKVSFFRDYRFNVGFCQGMQRKREKKAKIINHGDVSSTFLGPSGVGFSAKRIEGGVRFRKEDSIFFSYCECKR